MNSIVRRADDYSRAGLAVMAIRIAGAGLGLIAQILASRLIGAEAFGYYALALVWLLLLGHGATGGTNQLICRLLSSYRASGQMGAASGLLRFAMLFAGGIATLVTIVAVLLIQTGIFGLSPDLVILFSFTFAVIPLLVAQDMLEAIARGLDKPTVGIAPAMLMRHIAILAGTAALLLLGAGGDALTILAMTIAGLVLSVAIQAVLLARHLRKILGGGRPVYRTGFWIRTALPIALLDAAEVLFNNADILILGILMPAELVAAYYAATRIVQILSYAPYGISAATAQKYAALATLEDHDGLQSLIGSVTLVSTAMVAFGSLLLWLLAPVLLGLFGDEFVVAADVVPLLCLGIVLVCAFGPGEDVLTMLGQEKICSAIFAGAVVLNVVLNFTLIPLWGLYGAAIATTAALGLRGALLSYFAHLRLGLALPLATSVFLRTYRKEEATP